MEERSSYFPTRRMIGVGRPLASEIFGQTDADPQKNADFQSIFARSAKS